MAPVSRKRSGGDHRRKRLAQLLNHESGKVSPHVSSDRSADLPSPAFRGSKSLPTLPSLHPTKSTTFDLDAALVPATEQTPQLSPLKFTRPSEGVRRTDRSFVSLGSERPASIEAQLTGAPLPQTATSSKIISIAITSCRPQTQFGRGVHTPKKMDRAFPEQQIQELTNNEVNTDKEMKQLREMACAKHVRQLEIARRRTTIAAASQSFFDRLAFLPVRESIHIFEAQREALLNFCLQQFRGEVDDDELKTIHRDVAQMIAKAQKELQNRLTQLQKDESHVVQKKIALQQLKKYHHEQIELHLANSKEQRKQELAARECIVKEQERLNRGVEAREVERQQFTEAHRKKLAEQMKNNAIARSTFQLAAQGSSPLYRTPWWSDESDERLKGFQRPMTVQMPTPSPVIQCKKRCQWYD